MHAPVTTHDEASTMTTTPSAATWRPTTPQAPDLSLFQQIPLATDGTVTELLSLYCGQPVTARKLAQSVQEDDTRATGDDANPDTAGAADQHAVTKSSQAIALPRLLRSVVLQDAGGRPLLHAQSCFALELMPASIRHDLQHTTLPIGLLWRRERLEMYREIQACECGTAPAVAALLQVAPDAPLLRRTYVLFHQRLPMGAITETFAMTVLR